MDGYYNNQISLPYFAGAARQRGSGLGALAMNVGRLALPLFKNVLFPAAKRFARDLVVEALPEVPNLIDGKTSLKRAASKSLSSAAAKNFKRQRGSGGTFSKKGGSNRQLIKTSSTTPLITPPPTPKKKRPVISKKTSVKRSRYDLLKNLRN